MYEGGFANDVKYPFFNIGMAREDSPIKTAKKSREPGKKAISSRPKTNQSIKMNMKNNHFVDH